MDQKEKAKIYQREYYRKNKETIKKKRQDYHLIYYKNNKSKRLKVGRIYYKNNVERKIKIKNLALDLQKRMEAGESFLYLFEENLKELLNLILDLK